MKARVTALIFLLLLTGVLSAQNQKDGISTPWSVNVNIGPNLFYGDIEVYNFFPVMRNNNEWRAAYGAMIQKRINSLFTVRGQFLYGKLSGTKRKYSRWFEADIIETSVTATLDLTSLIWGYRNRRFSVYALGGVGLTQWRTELKDLNTNEVIRSNGYSGGSGIDGRTVEGVLPFGLGLDYRISNNWHVNIEGTLRPVNSDLLDANKGDFPYDFYSYNFVGLTYVFNKKKTAPPIELPPAEELITETDKPAPAEEIAVQELPGVESDEILEKEIRDIEDKILEDEAGKGLYEPTYEGIVFRVQVLASRDITEPHTVQKALSLNEKVYMNEGNGWFRYSVGSFTKYWKAKEYRNLLVSRYNIYDAFVVAYREDDRMPLSGLSDEIAADNISSQQSATEQQFTFRVQILASLTDDVNIMDFARVNGISEAIHTEKDGRWYKFTAGSFNDYQEALKYRDSMVRKGIRDAFVVAYENGIRVPLIKAIR